ncbi:hypothetical protein N9C59_03715 [Flavobacteriales bacterium]|nr:hypothetical protein [Flavobacteriales bacterium]
MRLPLIKHIVQFIEENDSDYIQETISVLENLTENSNINDDEMDVIGEILSNLYGSIEVNNAIERGASKKVALNDFMKRVQGSID